jgi:hypothetical protein
MVQKYLEDANRIASYRHFVRIRTFICHFAIVNSSKILSQSATSIVFWKTAPKYTNW